MKCKVLLVSILLILTRTVLLNASGQLVWIVKANMPTKRYGLAAVVLNDKIYAIGGSSNFITIPIVEIYDPATNVWAQGKNMNVSIGDASGAVLNNRIYVFGGTNVQEYDPLTDSWQTKNNAPDNISKAFVMNNKIYGIGSQLYEYNYITDAWTVRGPAIDTTNKSNIAVLNNKAYIMGGGITFPAYSLSAVEEYDINTNTWTAITNMLESRRGPSIVSLYDKIYTIGGYYGYGRVSGDGNKNLSSVEKYYPAINIRVYDSSMPTAREKSAVVIISSSMYVIGGVLNNYGGYPVNAVEMAIDSEYFPPPAIEKNTVQSEELNLGPASSIKKKIKELKRKYE